jgi:hypothetical protein
MLTAIGGSSERRTLEKIGASWSLQSRNSAFMNCFFAGGEAPAA